MTLLPEFIVLAVAASFFWALSQLMKKTVVSSFIEKPFLIAFVAAITSFIISIPLYFLQPIPVLNSVPMISLLASGAFYTAAVYLMMKALKVEEVSRIAPMAKITTVFTVLLATIFLGEIFTFEKYIGMALVILGSIMVSSKKFGKEFFRLEANRAFWLMILSAFLFGSSWVLLKFGTGFTGFWTAFFWSRLGGAAPFSLLLLVPSLRQDILSLLSGFRSKRPDLVAVSEVFNTGGIFLNTIALTLGPVSLVSTAASTTPLFVLLMATGLQYIGFSHLQEDLSRRTWILKAFAALLVVIGIYLIS